ncbi:MAG: addiction module protein [Candidatus Rokuibacteriota bacterium]
MSNRGLDIASLTPEDRLAATPQAVPLTEARRAELDRRLDDLDREGPVGIPWEEVLSRIRRQHR